MIEIDMQSSKKGQGRESIQSPLIILLLYSVVAIVVIYAITHMYMYIDYTQYINTCNHGQVRPHDACSICLVLHMLRSFSDKLSQRKIDLLVLCCHKAKKDLKLGKEHISKCAQIN